MNGSEEIFDIAGNSSKPDCFEDLASHVEILNVALNDIDGYDMAERMRRGKQPTRNPYGSPGKSLEQQTELEQVMGLLDRLHGKIGESCADVLRICNVLKIALQRILVWLTWHGPVQRLVCNSSLFGFISHARQTKDAVLQNRTLR